MYVHSGQVQQDVLQKRRAEKKASLDAIKRFRKGKGDKPAFLARRDDDDDGFPVAALRGEKGESSKGQSRDKSKKRQIRVWLTMVQALTRG